MPSLLLPLLEHPIIPAFLAANLAIGFWAHRKTKANSFEDYALASRSLPTGVLVMTLVATKLDSGYLAYPDHTYFYGLLHSSALVTMLLVFVFIGTFLAPCLVYFNDCLTLGDLMGEMYGEVIRIFSAVVSLFFSFLIVSGQVSAMAVLGHKLLGITPMTSVAIFGGIVVLYSALGGMRAVSYTDVLQAIASLVALGWVTQVLLQKIGGATTAFEWLNNEYPSKLSFFSHPLFKHKLKSAYFWSFSLAWVLNPPIIQRMLLVQDKRKVRRAWYTGALFYACISAMLILIGLVAIKGKSYLSIGGRATNNLLLHIIKVLFGTRAWVVDALFIGLLAFSVSTMDSFLHSAGLAFVQDFIEPLRRLLGKKPLGANRKTFCAKLSVFIIGISSLVLGSMNSVLESQSFHKILVCVYITIILPLVIGLLGIKTDKFSWWSFVAAYITSLLLFHSFSWHIYDTLLAAVPLAILAYFLTHIIRNRGIVTLRRSKLTVAERLWLPSWSGLRKKLLGFIKAPLHLPTLADRKVVHTPMHPLAFSMLIFALYTLSSIFSSGGVEAANFMAAIHFVGITLCCGLMLRGIWPASLKPYFPLYWFFTLFYCLPFGGTLAFLRVHDGLTAMVLWIASFVLLAYLVDSTSFVLLEFLGVSLALGGWCLVEKGLPADSWNGYVVAAFSILFVHLLALLLFGSSKEARTNERLYWNRIASSILGHDLRGSTQMLGGAGNILEKTFEIGEPSTNEKGEKGYWLPFAQSQFLAQFSTEMSKKAASSKKEIGNFMAFIQGQIMGAFEQQAVSMRAMVEEGMEKIGAKVKSSRVKLTLEVKKDFEAKVLAGIFPNVIANLLMNATTHGKASEIKVTIDGEARTITVRDNGEGIPPDVLPRIFDLNYSTAGDGKKNSGVGLAFVQMALDASDAKITCRSRKGKGSFTEFVLNFALRMA